MFGMRVSETENYMQIVAMLKKKKFTIGYGPHQ
jgi:hypothetical protein